MDRIQKAEEERERLDYQNLNNVCKDEDESHHFHKKAGDETPIYIGYIILVLL